MKVNCSGLVLSLHCLKNHTMPGHQNVHGRLTHLGRKPSVHLVHKIQDFRAFLALDELCDWAPLTSPTSLCPWYLCGLAIPFTTLQSPHPCALASVVPPLKEILKATDPAYISRYLEIFSEDIYTEICYTGIPAPALGQMSFFLLSFSYLHRLF